MKRMETAASVMLAAGLGLLRAGRRAHRLPAGDRTCPDLEYSTLDKIAPEPSPEFVELPGGTRRRSKQPSASPPKRLFARRSALGRDTYIAEACWHCHSQFVRPVSNEDSASARSRRQRNTGTRCSCRTCSARGGSGRISSASRAGTPTTGTWRTSRPDASCPRVGDATVHVVLRRRDAEQDGLGDDHVRAMAGKLGDARGARRAGRRRKPTHEPPAGPHSSSSSSTP